MNKLDKIEKEKVMVFKGEKPLIECKTPNDLSERQFILYKEFKQEIRNRSSFNNKR